LSIIVSCNFNRGPLCQDLPHYVLNGRVRLGVAAYVSLVLFGDQVRFCSEVIKSRSAGYTLIQVLSQLVLLLFTELTCSEFLQERTERAGLIDGHRLPPVLAIAVAMD
jgi:hypothetical protein